MPSSDIGRVPLADRLDAEIDTQPGEGRKKLNIEYLPTFTGRPTDEKGELAASAAQLTYKRGRMFELPNRPAKKVGSPSLPAPRSKTQ